MNAWQLAAGLLVLAVPFAAGQAWVERQRYKKPRLAFVVGAVGWLLVVAAGCVLVYGGLPEGLRG